jgi:hypothetical protein
MVKTMAKRKREHRLQIPMETRLEPTPDVRLIDEPKPREFVPRDCSMCAANRPPRTNYSRVYAKHGKVRYCKCGFCGNTWAQEGP